MDSVQGARSRQSLLRLQNQFDRAANDYPGVIALMTETALDRKPVDGDGSPPLPELGFAPPRSGKTCPNYRRSHTGYVNGKPFVSAAPLRNASSVEVDPDSLEGRMLQAGSYREYFVYCHEVERKRFYALAADAGKLVRQLTPEATELIAPESAAEEDDVGRWIWVVFDLAWARVPGSALSAEKKVWCANEMMLLKDVCETPEVLRENEVALQAYRQLLERPDIQVSEQVANAEIERREQTLNSIRQIQDRFPFPPDRYCSLIEDMMAASVHAIELLLPESDPMPTGEPTNWTPFVSKAEINGVLQLNDRKWKTWFDTHQAALAADGGLKTAKNIRINLAAIPRQEAILIATMLERRITNK